MRRTALALLALSLAHGGCFWVAAGGAGYGGYKVGTDERSVGTQFDDASITSAVKTRLLADSEVGGLAINVDTYEGVVTLHGTVEHASEAERAVRIARGVKGVRDVHSKLSVVGN